MFLKTGFEALTGLSRTSEAMKDLVRIFKSAERQLGSGIGLESLLWQADEGTRTRTFNRRSRNSPGRVPRRWRSRSIAVRAATPATPGAPDSGWGQSRGAHPNGGGLQRAKGAQAMEGGPAGGSRRGPRPGCRGGARLFANALRRFCPDFQEGAAPLHVQLEYQRPEAQPPLVVAQELLELRSLLVRSQ